MDSPKTNNNRHLISSKAKTEHKHINKVSFKGKITAKDYMVESPSFAEEKVRGAFTSRIRDETTITKDEEQDRELDYFKKTSEEDSDYQFSEEIMLSNPKRESRRDRQKGKICHLSIADWMMRVSSMLRLTKQCAYRAIIMMRRFMFLEQKKAPSRVTFSNANLYAMACLLIANKFQNYPGNFLSSIVHIEGSHDITLEKEHILECELYILTILQFNAINHIFIVENLFEVVQEWNQQATRTTLSRYQLKRGEQLIQIWERNEQAIQISKRGDLLEVFLYLVDFVTIRKLVELRIKELKVAVDPFYFKKIIVNVLYHLILHLIGNSGKDVEKIELKAFNIAFANLVVKVKMQRSEIALLKRKSHLISKELRSLYSHTFKWENIRKTASYHRSCQERFCICELNSLSKKYLDEEELKQKQRIYEEMFPCQTRQSKRQDLNDTDHLIIEKQRDKPPKHIQVSQKNEIKKGVEPDAKQICPVCPKNVALLRLIINQQFYVPFFLNKK